jgi:hypothetical protein
MIWGDMGAAPETARRPLSRNFSRPKQEQEKGDWSAQAGAAAPGHPDRQINHPKNEAKNTAAMSQIDEK